MICINCGSGNMDTTSVRHEYKCLFCEGLWQKGELIRHSVLYKVLDTSGKCKNYDKSGFPYMVITTFYDGRFEIKVLTVSDARIVLQPRVIMPNSQCVSHALDFGEDIKQVYNYKIGIDVFITEDKSNPLKDLYSTILLEEVKRLIENGDIVKSDTNTSTDNTLQQEPEPQFQPYYITYRGNMVEIVNEVEVYSGNKIGTGYIDGDRDNPENYIEVEIEDKEEK